MKMKVVLIKSESSNIMVTDCYKDGSCIADRSDEYFRVSEPVEVDFTELDRHEIVNEEVNVIDKKIIKLSGQITALETRKKELLCIEAKI